MEIAREIGEQIMSERFLPYFHKTARSGLVWFRSASMRCGMRRMFFQSMVAHKCNEDHYADL